MKIYSQLKNNKNKIFLSLASHRRSTEIFTTVFIIAVITVLIFLCPFILLCCYGIGLGCYMLFQPKRKYNKTAPNYYYSSNTGFYPQQQTIAYNNNPEIPQQSSDRIQTNERKVVEKDQKKEQTQNQISSKAN
jgi:hypothetical protein